MGERKHKGMMMGSASSVEVSAAEWEEIVDKAAQFHLGMSGEEFSRRRENGEFDDPDDGPAGLMAVLALVIDE